MTEDIEKQKRIVAEAMETAKIVNDLETKEDLAVQLMKLNELEEIPEEELMQIRLKHGLNTFIWLGAEFELLKRKEN